MALMLEVSDDASELKDWIERMDDEEGEEDADELYQVGEECIDRFVEAVGWSERSHTDESADILGPREHKGSSGNVRKTLPRTTKVFTYVSSRELCELNTPRLKP